MRKQYALVSDMGTARQNSRIVNSHEQSQQAPPFSKGKTPIDEIESTENDNMYEEFAIEPQSRPLQPDRPSTRRPIRPSHRRQPLRPVIHRYEPVPVYIPQYTQPRETLYNNSVSKCPECKICPDISECPGMFGQYPLVPLVIISIMTAIIIILILRMNTK